MKLTIPVEKWLHGQEDAKKKFGPEAYVAGSQLHRREDDKLCCLGHYLLACGVPLEHLSGNAAPSDVQTVFIPTQAEWLLGESVDHYPACSPDADKLMQANDTTANRELIKEVFAKHDVEVEFVEAAS